MKNVTKSPRITCFNGAALFTGRRGPPMKDSKQIKRMWLQWGRPFYRAESISLLDFSLADQKGGFNGAALFTGRRAVSTQKLARQSPSRFNGAALFTGRRENPNSLISGIFNLPCFNGAALFTGRRESSTNSVRAMTCSQLQWGRPFYRAERSSSTGTTIPLSARQASMGPPFLRGGEGGVDEGTDQGGEASMGPPFLRGGEINVPIKDKNGKTFWLQWGRPFYRAESQTRSDRQGEQVGG